MKRLLFIVLCVMNIASVSSAENYDGGVCRDYANIYIDTLYANGYIKVFYTDCDGIYHEDRFECEALNICVDTDYAVHLGAYSDDGYLFDSWSNDNIIDSNSVSFIPCHDTTIEPVFKHYDHQDDDSGCFIKTIK